MTTSTTLLRCPAVNVSVGMGPSEKHAAVTDALRELAARAAELGVFVLVREASPEQTALHFEVSRDEEWARMTVRRGTTALKLPARTHHYLLLTLARARAQDRAEGLDEAQCGWRHTVDLEAALRVAPGQVNLMVHRARRQLAKQQASFPEALVERREGSGQLRIGVADLSIEVQ